MKTFGTYIYKRTRYFAKRMFWIYVGIGEVGGEMSIECPVVYFKYNLCKVWKVYLFGWCVCTYIKLDKSKKGFGRKVSLSLTVKDAC